MSKKKGQLMQVQSARDLPPLPKRERKEDLQVEVNGELYDEMLNEMKRSGITKKREVVEYGIRAFIQKSKSEAGLVAHKKAK